MASQADYVDKMQLRQSYRNLWHTDLMGTISAHPSYCCFSIFCGPCVSYLLRKRALYNDLSRYTCCGGYMPCSGKCGESKCPAACLCTEVFCCFTNSVASTRFMLQDEFNIQTTECDNCIIGFMLCLSQLACICSLIACLLGSEELQETAHIMSCLSNFVYCTVCACMQTQHKLELDKRDGNFGPQPAMAVPPTQQMSRMAQPVPDPDGYPPPPVSGQPFGYPPPPPAQGYPVPAHYRGYPPTGYAPYPTPGQYN
ncbi:uncharacterized protein LOC111806364 [Cucurbita pepo subsp. pepo]|uniref:uncharacterized protein LOC111806364 n=1 Tax=Cucurbita pepo subsp. pepo TaxID=3664 RepID=UPI000C9D378E|nr:uncharacterized protein LOC111806364 [Cucurbita pepo subsp. pepo]XP_023547404.1 uncharacterized protein LOC111806364 [Cucurbita pepo subsp. pepo]